MAIYLATDHREERATTNLVMAAIEACIGWMLLGPRQHGADLRWSLAKVASPALGESGSEGR